MGKVFRVFVSSTFSDLKAEREALQRHVWPALSALCRQHSARFQAIDLRWGVSEEAGLDQQTMPICLGEIARCQLVSPRPNFIVLLGDRYGWRPLPAVIPASEMDVILAKVTEAERGRLLWSPERPAEQNGWYRRDDNAIPPEYVLLPRERGSRFADRAEWDKVERGLLAILERAIRGLPMGVADRLKYGASATEQEIGAGALRVEDAARHVHCFFRTIDGLPDRVAPLPTTDVARDLRDYADDGTRDPAVIDGRALQDRLLAVKNTLRDRLGDGVHDRYRARWLAPEDRPLLADGTPSPISLDHVDQLCLDVFESLARTILLELREQQQVDPQLAEERAHDDFCRQRAEVFVGRHDVLARVASYLATGDRRTLLIHGVSGSGKSALMARAVTAAWAAHGGLPRNASGLLRSGIAPSGARVALRFIGATPESSDGRALLQSLCQQLARDYDADQTTVPADFNALATDFRERVGQASAERPLLLFLDGLDQLGEANNARALFWLPTELPEHVRVVVSALSDPDSPASDCYRALERRLPVEHQVPIEPLRSEEADELLMTWLTLAGRTLDGGHPRAEVPAGQRAEVLGHRAGSGLPLYLQLALEAARRWRSFSPIDETRLAEDAPGLIRGLFRNLADDSMHGPALVESSLALLAAAKNGLAEDELLELLSPTDKPAPELHTSPEAEWRAYIASRADWAVLADYHRRSPRAPRVTRLPVVLWSRLALDLRPYLAERSGDGAALLNFYHRQVRQVVEADYLRAQAGIDRHRQIAEYFRRQAFEISPNGADGHEPEAGAAGGTGRREPAPAEPSAAAGPDTAIRERAIALVAASGLTAGAGVRSHPNLRKLSELPYQQTFGKQWDELFATLTDFTFLERKAATGEQTRRDAQGRKTKTYSGVFDLQADYELALMHFPGAAEGAGTGGIGTGVPIITAVQFPNRDTPVFRCPKCLRFVPLREAWLGTTITCPQEGCGGRLRLNPFVAGRPDLDKRPGRLA